MQENSSNKLKATNAMIALVALQSINDDEGLYQEYINRVEELVKRLAKTDVVKDVHSQDEEVLSAMNTAFTEQAINLIEEYLKEQGI